MSTGENTTATSNNFKTKELQQSALPLLQKTAQEIELEQLDLDTEAQNRDNILTPELVIYDPENTKKDIVQTFARQSYSNALAFIEVDFYDKLAKLSKTPEIDKELINRRIGQFVSRRIDKLLTYAANRSDSVMESLSIEERDLYVRLCEAVTDFRNVLEKKFSLE